MLEDFLNPRWQAEEEAKLMTEIKACEAASAIDQYNKSLASLKVASQQLKQVTDNL